MVALFIINDSPLTYNSFVGIEGLSHRKTLTTQCIWCIIIRLAAVAELADARDLKSCSSHNTLSLKTLVEIRLSQNRILIVFFMYLHDVPLVSRKGIGEPTKK